MSFIASIFNMEIGPGAYTSTALAITNDRRKKVRQIKRRHSFLHPGAHIHMQKAMLALHYGDVDAAIAHLESIKANEAAHTGAAVFADPEPEPFRLRLRTLPITHAEFVGEGGA